MNKDVAIFKNRRIKLIQKIKQANPNKSGIVLLFGALENNKNEFRQESSFYYLTGIEDPGAALIINLDGKETLYVPQYAENRAKSVSGDISKTDPKKFNLDEIQMLGDACTGYEFSCLFSDSEYKNIIAALKTVIDNNQNIFVIKPAQKYVEQRLLLERVEKFLPAIASSIIDISACIAELRRIKSQSEIEALYNAIDCTMAAHEAAAQIIEQDKYEYQVAAGIEFIFAESNAKSAFPSIVATGANATVLHHTKRNGLLKKGELVIVDIGAELDHYCADITRTYPVSGHWTNRQRQLYTLVLETQEYIASLAKPGMYLSNKDHQDISLHHLAVAFLSKAGYGQYFNHSIGHYLGLDVHDVGSYAEPLQEGDVITIEPGIYIPEEKMGIRIEDNYWITKEGAICLSQDLPKDPSVIEEMMIQVDEEDFND